MRRRGTPRILTLARCHIALLAAGLVFLLVAAFSGYIWFDESYTLALIGHSPQEIWSIGSYDVHPILYYEALHALLPALDAVGGAAVALARTLGLDPAGSLGAAADPGFAARVLGTRLFSIAGAWATALLGFTHVRHDHGGRAGIIFTLLALFTPMLVELSSQIRMYSWAVFAAVLCCICSLRIARRLHGGSAAGTRLWTVFALSSLAAAYLHYYGTLTAFALNALLLAALVRGRTHGAIRIWIVQAAVQVIAYLPWIAVAVGQASSVSHGFWISLDPFASIAPFGWPLAMAAALWACARRRLYAVLRETALWGIAVYAAVLGLALAASLAMGHPIVVERYLSIPLSPALLAIAVLADAALESPGERMVDDANPTAASRARSHRLGPPQAAVLVSAAVLVALGVARQSAIVRSTYHQSAALDALDELVAREPDAPIVSDSITSSGVAAVARPEDALTYINPYSERNAQAYRAYSPTMRIVSKKRDAWPEDGTKFIYLTASSAKREKTAADIERATGGSVLDLSEIERPYERQHFYIALVRRGNAAAAGVSNT